MNNEYKIILDNISKKINNNNILENINLKLESGKIYGIRGRNGSGKTMLLRVMTGLVLPDSGKIVVDGNEISKNKGINDKIGAIIETPGFINYYSGFKNLKILASIRNTIDDKKICDTMTSLGLDPYDKKKVRAYSLGMKQKLGIAQAIMEDPEIILLDEPMNSLDSNSIKIVYDIINKLKDNGHTILLASHSKEDIELLCDEVFFMEDGKLIKER